MPACFAASSAGNDTHSNSIGDTCPPALQRRAQVNTRISHQNLSHTPTHHLGASSCVGTPLQGDMHGMELSPIFCPELRRSRGNSRSGHALQQQ